MTTVVTILGVWALGSVLFVVALATATRSKSLSGHALGRPHGSETAESILERLRLSRPSGCGYASGTPQVGSPLR